MIEFRVDAYVSSKVSRTVCIREAPFVLSYYEICSSLLSNGDNFIKNFTYTVKIVVNLSL